MFTSHQNKGYGKILSTLLASSKLSTRTFILQSQELIFLQPCTVISVVAPCQGWLILHVYSSWEHFLLC